MPLHPTKLEDQTDLRSTATITSDELQLVYTQEKNIYISIHDLENRITQQQDSDQFVDGNFDHSPAF